MSSKPTGRGNGRNVTGTSTTVGQISAGEGRSVVNEMFDFGMGK